MESPATPAFPEGSVNAVHVLAKALTGSGLLTGSGAEAVKAVAEMTSDYNGGCCGIPFEDKESGRLTCVAAWSMAGQRCDEGVL